MFLARLMSPPASLAVLAVGLALLLLWLGARRVVARLEARLGMASLEDSERIDLEEAHERAAGARAVLRWLTLLVPAGFLVWAAISGTPMQSHVMSWIQMLVRWAHVIAGIMWIGASFYFIFLENHLERTRGVREELAGNLWAIHGGGFYYVEKYKVAPARLPEKLHWFKYEAYFTWLTGVALLTLVYYLDARAFLVDPSVATLSVPVALAVAIGSLVLGWVVYDQLCRSALIRRPGLLTLAGVVLLAGFVFALTHLLSGRAAYLHVGALIGTIMAGNVFFVIIPSQRALVRAARTGRPPDSSLGRKAGLRSLHNNYLTLPVVFTMISIHFPGTFGHEHRALVLMVIMLASAGIKHYWNLLDRGIRRPWILATSLLALVGASLAVSPAFDDALDLAQPVSFGEVNAIVQARCASCHSATPTDDVFTVAPNGVMYDTPQQLHDYADKIMLRAVRTQSMPLANKTGMTDQERLVLKRWILQGARTTP